MDWNQRWTIYMGSKEDTIYNFDKINGLCDNIIRGITEDNLKNIWITTSNGLSILTVNRDLNNVLSISSRNFSARNGLIKDYFNNSYYASLEMEIFYLDQLMVTLFF